MNIAIQPTAESRAEETNDGEGKEMKRVESSRQRSVTEQR